jgi:hypothetical protein
MISQTQSIVMQMAEQNRVVLSPWRALILLRRATFSLADTERRWNLLPTSQADIAPILRQMRIRGDIESISEHAGFHRLTVPFARQMPVDEQELLFELFPYAIMSHRSALLFHGLSVERPQGFTLTQRRGHRGDLIPPGTKTSDWDGIELPNSSRTRKVLRQPVEWHTIQPDRFWGFSEYEPRGFPIRVTTLERTLIDGLMKPDLCGGIEAVLEAWLLSRDTLDVETLVAQIERYDMGILRQRAGFVLEQLGLDHPHLSEWKAQTQRGGSSKLVASAPFDNAYNVAWNLSINAPLHSLGLDTP